MRSPIRDSNSNSNPDYLMIGMGARDFYLKKPQAMAGQSNHSIIPTATQTKIAENSPKAERERKKEYREKSSPEPDSRTTTGVLMC